MHRKIKFVSVKLIALLFSFIIFSFCFTSEAIMAENINESKISDYSADKDTTPDLTADKKRLTDISELKNMNIGIQDGSVYENEVRELIEGSTVTNYSQFAEFITALQKGLIDAYVTDKAMARYQIESAKGFYYLDEVLTHEDYNYIVNKDNPLLLNEINKAIESLRSDGTLERLQKKWMNNTKHHDLERVSEKNTSKGVLRIVTAADQPPFSFIENGEITGYDTDVTIKIAERMGYRAEFTNSEYLSLIPAVMDKKYDMANGCFTETKERGEQVLFTNPVYTGETVCVLYNEEKEENFLGSLKASFIRTFVREQRWKLILKGLGITIFISVLSLIFGTLLGFVFSFLLRSSNKYISSASNILSTFLDAMPILITLMIFYYIIFSHTDLSAVWIGVIAMTLDFSNAVAGILNAGIMSVSRGEIDAAKAMGYNKIQTFMKIILPQVAHQMSSQYNGAVNSLIKGTSVVGYITVTDLTKAGDIIRSRTYEAFFPLIMVAAIYFLLASLICRILKACERKLDPKFRKRQVKGVVAND